MSTRRIAESVEGLISSLALAAGNLWPKKGQPITVVNMLRMGFLTIWLSCKPKWSMLLQVLMLKTWAKNQLSVEERSKLLTLHEVGYSERLFLKN